MKNRILLILKIILSGIILVYLFSVIPVNEIVKAILSADLTFFFAGMLLAAPISYLSALQTRYLTGIQGMELSVLEILRIHLATNFYGLFLPGTLSGGAVKWYKFSRYGSKSSAAAVVVFNRFLEVLMTVFTGILFSLPVLYSPENKELITILIVIFILMIIFYFLLMNKAGINFIDKITSKLNLPDFIKHVTGRLIHAMLQFQNLKFRDHLEITGLLALYHIIGILSFYCFARSLDIDLSIWTLGWIRSAMSLAIMLPLSFAGLGIREGTLVFLLGKYNISPDVSMALSFLFFFRSVLTSLIGGFFELKDFTLPSRQKDLKINDNHSIREK